MKKSLFLPIFIATTLFAGSPLAAQPKQAATSEAVNQVTTVNINTATAAELSAKLKGIGSKKAQLIVDYRNQHNGFSSPEELTEVKGIGDKLLQENAEIVRVK